jgi:SAM-dependent methyltransferase
MSDDAERFFDAIARRYDRVYALTGDASRERLRQLSRLLGGMPRRRVLVLGVGTGRELGRLQDDGHLPTGLDLSTSMLALAGLRARPVPLVLADFWKPLGFDDGAFDAVVALHGTVAHPPSPAEESVRKLASEIARVLTPNGVIVLEIPTREFVAALDTPIDLSDGRTLSRQGESTVLHRDSIANVELRAELLPRATWEALFGERFEQVALSELSPGEVLLAGSTPKKREALR